MGMSNLLLDNEDKFWKLADEVISEWECFEQFWTAMQPQADLLQGTPSHCETDNELEDLLSEAWSEKWSEYV